MSDLTLRCSLGLALGLLLLAPAAGQALTIDNFVNGSVNLIAPNTTFDLLVAEAGGGLILGGDREETIDNQSLVNFITAGSNGLSWTYGQLNAPGTGLLIWDGTGGGTGSVEHGLRSGGVGTGADFTESGVHDALQVSILSNDAIADITLTIFSGAGNFSTSVIQTTGGPGTLLAEFATFTIGGGIGADFTDVSAFTLSADGVSEPDLDVTFSFIETTAAPEPSTAVLLALGLAALTATQRRSDHRNT